jgi:prolyl oligopeptidase
VSVITTADHDDRVVPAHSFKYAAALQKAADPARPALIRIDSRSGHGASNATKQFEQTADVYAFLMHNLGAVPLPPAAVDVLAALSGVMSRWGRW